MVAWSEWRKLFSRILLFSSVTANNFFIKKLIIFNIRFVHWKIQMAWKKFVASGERVPTRLFPAFKANNKKELYHGSSRKHYNFYLIFLNNPLFFATFFFFLTSNWHFIKTQIQSDPHRGKLQYQKVHKNETQTKNLN